MSATTQFDTPPEISLEAIRTFDGLVLVDLDETLYLRNSTEDFIDCATPGLVALTLLKSLDVLKPWNLTGGKITRDVWRVQTIRIFAPWVMSAWKRRVTLLAQQFANSPLVAALKSRSELPVISTVGFKPIVTPLVAALGFANSQVISARMNFQDRRCGKLILVNSAIGDAAVQGALVVTDSVDDLPLLSACAKPLRTVWPAARYRTALTGIYVPGRYLTRVKRPNERYIWRGILQEDFALWLLSSIGLAAEPLTSTIGLLFLLASFWAIYERGYVDNDWVASHYEREPKLSDTYRDHTVATPAIQPWLWAIVLGAVGVAVLRLPGIPTPLDFGKWAGVLAATEVWFKLYNRTDKATRIWMYAVLQFGRSAAFVAIVPITPIGAVALGAHTLSRWVPYYAYRLGGKKWPAVHPQLIRLLFFVILAILLAAATGWSALVNLPAALILTWSLFRARRELSAVVNDASRLSESSRGDGK
jgi:hypothetical protein